MVSRNTSDFFVLNIRREFLVCLFLVAVILTVYLQVRHFDFVDLDDTFYITYNNKVRSGITPEGIKWAFTANHCGYWIPLTWLSHMLDCHLYGLNAGNHHITNVLFHIINTILLFLLFRHTTDKIWQSGFVAVLFAIHPLHVESVAWIAERKDVLSTFFLLLSMQMYFHYVKKIQVSYYLLSLFFFTLGLMAKPMVVTLPFMLLLMDFWPLGRLRLFSYGCDIKTTGTGEISIKKLIQEKIPFFFFAVLSGVITIIFHLHTGALASLNGLSFGFRFYNALISYVIYIVQMLLPFNLAVLYPFPGDLPAWQIISSSLSLIAITLFTISFAGKSPYLITGWLWYLGTLVPVTGVFQVGLQARADRFTYIPSIGLFIMLAWGIPELLGRLRLKKYLLTILAVSVIVLYSIVAWIQVGYWSDSVHLFSHTLDITSDNYLISHNLNVALRRKGKDSEADKYYFDALRIRYGLDGVDKNLKGIDLVHQGRCSDAIQYYTRLLLEQSNSVDTILSLGNAYVACGQLDEAENNYIKVLTLKPESAEALNNYGLIMIRKGKLEEAAGLFRDALKYRPDYLDAEKNLKRALFDKQKIEDAIAELGSALDIDPNDSMLIKKCEILGAAERKLYNIVDEFCSTLVLQPGFEKEMCRKQIMGDIIEGFEDNFPIFNDINRSHPKAACVYYQIAGIYAKQGNTKRSLKCLKAAIDTGYNDWEMLNKDKDFELIRTVPQFEEIVKGINHHKN